MCRDPLSKNHDHVGDTIQKSVGPWATLSSWLVWANCQAVGLGHSGFAEELRVGMVLLLTSSPGVVMGEVPLVAWLGFLCATRNGWWEIHLGYIVIFRDGLQAPGCAPLPSFRYLGYFWVWKLCSESFRTALHKLSQWAAAALLQPCKSAVDGNTSPWVVEKAEHWSAWHMREDLEKKSSVVGKDRNVG